MLNGKKVVVVLPAFNAENTLKLTYRDIPKKIVDEIILTDDGSRDKTVKIARKLGLKIYKHKKNQGYGANQKTCYRQALKAGADIVVMVHPDYQYDPRLITALVSLLAYDVYDVALGSRIIGKTALSGGMPLYKYLANRALTFVQNLLMRQKLSEYHTGLRAYKKEVLRSLPLEENGNDFIFDNQVLTQIFYFNYTVGEVSCPTKYFPEASSINLSRSLVYGIGCLADSALYLLARRNLYKPKFLARNGRRLKVK